MQFMLKYLLAAVIAIAPIAAFADSTVHGLATTTTSPLPVNSCIYVDQGGNTDTKLCSGWATALGGLVAASNLSDLTSAATARTNLGLTALATTTPGTGVATALGVNVGTSGAFITNGGALGTPSSGTLTNATGLPVSTGVSGLGTGSATALGTNVGSAGSFITNGGAIGTPSSGTLTSVTGLPLTTGVTGILPGTNGGTGINNGTNTLTLGGATSLPAAPGSTQCLHMASTGVVTASGADCGGVPVTFVGNTAGAANTYTIASPTPSGFTLTDQFLVCGSISATNTGASTLNVAATGAKPINKQTVGGFGVLAGGELVSGNQTCFQYNTANTVWVVITSPAGGVSQAATTTTVTAAQWANGQVFDVQGAGQTLTLAVATSLPTNGGIIVKTEGNPVTLAPNAADGINGVTIGTSVTIPANTTTVVTTSGASGTTAFSAPLGLVAGANVTLTPNSNGTTSIASSGGAGAVSLVGTTQVASTSAALTFTSIGTSAYYQLRCTALVPVTAGSSILLEVSEDNGSTFKTASYKQWLTYWTDTVSSNGAFSTLSNASTAGITNTNGGTVAALSVGNGTTNAAPGTDAILDFGNLTSAAGPKKFIVKSNTYDGTNFSVLEGAGAYTGDNGAINAFRLRYSSGNITSGQCSLYGYSS